MTMQQVTNNKTIGRYRWIGNIMIPMFTQKIRKRRTKAMNEKIEYSVIVFVATLILVLSICATHAK